MRLWLKDSERRPDPLPARTDARAALLTGTVAWLLALTATLIWRDQITAAGLGWWVWCAMIGVVLGLLALLWVQLRRRR
ncbi:DUF2530 domain-containing protein [Cryobacterium psychrophilum]|uniref:DUF2530 domain-containing protein n=1 Tax=Cryobacterium psychrophilum TaxID=41988 RepID=A0A4Y8KV78_9MICO|nr:DUF2530 domain-containing protein [Cryobacterium psychrophilum]TDW29470.1 uncharacterized protein DUF2530 [Cryobacterium psychrophilum]TFD81396.1 DUF2530 domain-containing protein [Cryobacterium psychrophilum]